MFSTSRHSRPPAASKSRLRRLSLEQLEDRRLLAIAVNDSFWVQAGHLLTADAITNDTYHDANNPGGSITNAHGTFTSNPAHGSRTVLNEQGRGLQFRYTPSVGFHGVDS